ncbi:MAG: prolyl oligopeptidase family serine peptidase [Planctomycetia bacterium]
MSLRTQATRRGAERAIGVGICAFAAVTFFMRAAGATETREAIVSSPVQLVTPPELWADFDPEKGDFNEEIIKQETKDGIYSKESFISAYVMDEEVRVYCVYRVKEGAVRAPGLLNVHGWMGVATIDQGYVNDGWAVMSFDYCGEMENRPRFTRYPERLRHANMTGPVAHSHRPDGTSITDPRQASDYVWYAIQSRMVSYLARQKEVDPTRLAAKGYSYGGTLMWPLATDPRIKAVVAHFGIGWNEYYRSKRVWMYAVPPVEVPKSPGEEIFLAALAPEAHVPHITAATLWLNGSNDHHGGHERALESFKMFKPGVPSAFAIQARGHHNTDRIEQDAKMWLEKHVLGEDVFWPAQPASAIRLNVDGVPELVVTPANPERVKSVEMYYAIKEPCSYHRSWRDATSVHQGNSWIAALPVMNVNDYVFGYANVFYDTTLALSTEFNAAIPARLGPHAEATDRRSESFTSGRDGMVWINVAEVEGVGGIKGFRATDNRKGTHTVNLGDPKWQAPPGSRLEFKFYCTEPQRLAVTAVTAANFVGEIEITASDTWQSRTIHPHTLVRQGSTEPLRDWANVSSLYFKPTTGSDITKVIFAEFRWVGPEPSVGK